MKKTPIAVFVSGRGSNLEALLLQENNFSYSVNLIVLSSRKEKPIALAKLFNIDYVILEKESFNHTPQILLELQNKKIEYIILAGFLWKIPPFLLDAFPQKIINIHPALLPKYGGKGMYGMNIHRAVIENKETKSGISIHLVNEQYDEGKLLFQKEVFISPDDTAQTLADKVLALEHRYYGKIIEQFIK